AIEADVILSELIDKGGSLPHAVVATDPEPRRRALLNQRRRRRMNTLSVRALGVHADQIGAASRQQRQGQKGRKESFPHDVLRVGNRALLYPAFLPCSYIFSVDKCLGCILSKWVLFPHS